MTMSLINKTTSLGFALASLLGLGLACDVEDAHEVDQQLRNGEIFCGGIANFPCPGGLTCVDDPDDDCDPLKGGADCGGICVGPDPCGGFGGLPCEGKGEVCVDDPSDDCDPSNGGADCGGLCVQPVFCGGFGGFPCAEGFACVDDPRDECDPGNGGSDCGGLCVPDASQCVGPYCEY
jgi:hypothetical protein